MIKSGFIMLNRNLVDWEWYTDVNTSKVFLHCLLKVNYSAKRWQGTLIKKDEFVTSYEKLAIETGLTISKVRTALSKLHSTKDIYIETTNSFTRIGVLNINKYVAESIQEQIDTSNNKSMSIPNSKLLTGNTQTNDNHLATTNTNNIINRKKIFREKVFANSNCKISILESFFNYWSELNMDKTKMRKENEPFFEVDKRLKKWIENERTNKSGVKTNPKLLTNR